MKFKCRVLSANGLILIATMVLLAALVPAHAGLQEGGLVDMQTQFSPADEQGRYVYLVEFSDPGLLQRMNRASGTRLDISAPATQAALSEVRNQQAEHLRSVTGALGRAVQVSHHYLVTHNGVAMRLTPEDARELASQDFVRSIERERIYELSTFRGPEFMGANQIWNGSATPDGLGLQGESMVAAILDTGVAPNHPSFANDPACGHGEGGAPDKLISFLDCQSTDGSGLCNGPSPQDNNSHGSHVASTVAGNRLDNSAVPSPNVPAPFTEISGVAPCAHVRTYHVCQPGGCPTADVQAGMNSVLLHGDVDVMNFSISGGTSPWADNDRRKLDLVDAGIFVAASAGNTTATITNPVGQVNHRGPWVASIAASTHDVTSGNQLSVAGGPQDALAVQGTGPVMSEDFTGQLRYAGDVDATNIEGCVAFPSNAFDGEAALISRGSCNFSVKVNNAVAAGATFVVVFNNAPSVPFVMGELGATTVSSVMVSQAVGQSIIAALDGATAEVFVDAEVATLIESAFGDNLANFSLRGPTPSPLQDLQKPDITAPGVGIWAASIQPGGYQFMSGTSMSGPHAAGAALLVRQANPDWTPSEVKSAMMMTAYNGGHKENGTTSWDPDDVGSGRVDLTQAALAGLVMDETFDNYLAADPVIGGDVKTLNLPAVRNLDCTPQCSFTRTLRNTLDMASSWTVTLGGFSPDLDIQVTPSTFSFTGDTNETVTLTITATPQANLTANIEFGRIMLSEDSDLAPGAHLTAAISGAEAEPAAAAIDETEFTILLEEGTSGSATFNISNVGTGAAVDDLLYEIDQAQPASVVLDLADQPASARDGQSELISLELDGFNGGFSGVGVGGGSFLWFNRFTPGLLDLPFTLQEVGVLWPTGFFNNQEGDVFDLYVWTSPDGDPTSGNVVFETSVTGLTLPAAAAFGTIALPGGGVDITADSGDVLIGLVNRTPRAQTSQAINDSGIPSRGRSWVAFNFSGGVGNPPVLTNAGTLTVIDNLVAGRNWIIRGFGTGGSACLSPSDVPWLTVTPTSGSVAVNTAEMVQINVDSTGLAPGSYEARICVNTSDTSNPVFVLPVMMAVTGAGGLPTIEVTPASLDFEVDVFDTGDSQLIDIANTGNDLTLDWVIEQAEGVADACDAPGDIGWLDVSQSAGSTASGGTSQVSVSVDASDLEPGSYTATLCVLSNDPANPLVEVPVSLEVYLPANAARIEGTVQGLGYCQANPSFAAGAGVEIVGTQETFNLTADANGYYSLFLDDANSPIDITVSAANHITASQTGVGITGQSNDVADFGLILEAACAQIVPATFSEVFGPGVSGGNVPMTIDNALGGAQLVWGIQEANPSAVNYTYGLEGAGELISATGGSRGSESVASEPLEGQTPFVDAGIQTDPISSNFTEGFDDITLLPSAGWSLQNLSDPLGATNWFQGSPAAFDAHEGEPNAYIGANFNNTAGTGTISNWLMAPEVQLINGTELRFWTRTGAGGNAFPDRLEVRLSTSGSSTFAGSAATDVGDFDTLLLSVNENLDGNYPEGWTEFVVEVSGLAAPTSGRFAFRYFVTNAGPTGTNGNFIGIDTVSIVQPNFCDDPSDVPWLSVSPFFGAADAGGSSVVNVTVDTTGLDTGSHDAFICVSSNDTENDLIQVPFNIQVLGDEVFQDRFEG